MERDSLLKGSVWKTQSDERHTTMLAEALAERDSAFADLIILIDNQSEGIAEQHPKPLDAAQAEAAYIRQLHQVLEVSSDRITAHFSGSRHVQALEQRVSELTAGQDHLRDEAYRASSLQADLDQAKAAEADAKAENSRLQRELATAVSAKNTAEAENSRLQRELATAVSAKNTAEAENSRIRPPTAPPLGQPGERLTTAAEPPPTPKKGRWGNLPGNRRRGSQGG